MRDITLGNTIYIKFTTRAFSTGVPTTLAGTPVLSIYEENNLTQITAGVSVSIDYDSVTGLNQATIVATSGNGYESGKSYDLVITTGTVGGVSVVGEVVGSFTVESEAAFSRIGLNGVGLSNIGTIATVTNLTNLPTIPANWLTAAGINASALNGKGDWNIGKTGYSLAATGLDAIVSTATGMVEIAKAIWDRVLTGATHNINNSAGKRLRQIAATDLIDSGTAQAGSSTTITLDPAANANNGFYDHVFIVIDGGTGVGQVKAIESYNGTTKVATITSGNNWIITPDNTSTYVLLPYSAVHVGVLTATALTSITGDIDTNSTQLSLILSDTADMQPKIGTPATSISADIAALNNFDPVNDVVANVTLVDTTTTNTDMRGSDTAPDNAGIADIQSRIPSALVGGRIDSNASAIDGNATSAANLKLSALGIVPGLCEGTPTTTVIQTDLAKTTNDTYVGRVIIFTSGNSSDEATDITAYDGTTGAVTVTALAVAPASGDSFVIV